MQIIRNIFDLNKAIKNFSNFGFVPTMGGIHDGHLSLIKNSQKRCKKTIVTIYVNPTQFNDKRDFLKYPKNLNKDIRILKKLKVNFLFIPSTNEIYKKKITSISIKSSDKVLCAKYRKGHFEGVLNIMNRFLTIIQAKYVFMGEKDFQQLYLVKKYLTKKHKVNIIGCKTVRDKNFIALSTRNKLLSNNNYLKLAKVINKFKKIKKKILIDKNFLKLSLVKEIKQIEDLYKIQIDYLEARNEKNLSISKSKRNIRLFVAFWINKVRFIDNY